MKTYMNKLIYVEEHEDKYKKDTWVELLDKGHYAITQTERLNKRIRHTVFLTRQQLKEILKEQEVSNETLSSKSTT